MNLAWDEILIAVALGSYTLGALALIIYFFSQEEWFARAGIPLGRESLPGCTPALRAIRPA